MVKPEDPVSLALVGIGGMGYFYLKELLENYYPQKVFIQGAVDPYPERSELYPELKRSDIPVFSTLEDLYLRRPNPELTVISSPIHCHVGQSGLALQNGSHVLCEKPLTAVVQDADALIRMGNKLKNWILIGYQWCFSDAIQNLKQDILKGIFGQPLRFKTLCLWHRDLSYYQRCDWAGKIKTSEGIWILDSPANNAMAHFLHNLLYLAGNSQYSSGSPVEITAEAYRAYPVENYDTVVCRILTKNILEILFYASHAVRDDAGPMFQLEFTDAEVSFDHSIGTIKALGKNGRVKKYGSPDLFPMKKLEYAVNAVRQRAPILCGSEASRAQTLSINGIQESIPAIIDFPGAMIDSTQKGSRDVSGLEKMLMQCYTDNMLPSEAGLTWARKGKRIQLDSYSYFPGGFIPSGREEKE